MTVPPSGFFEEATTWRSLVALGGEPYRIEAFDDRTERRLWSGCRVDPAARSGPRRWWSSPEIEFVAEDAGRRVVVRPAAGAWDGIELVEHDRVNGRIRQRNLLHSRFEIEAGAARIWVFRKPLFRSEFHAETEDGRFASAMVVERVHQWAIAVREDDDPDAMLRLALLYVHVRSYFRG